MKFPKKDLLMAFEEYKEEELINDGSENDNQPFQYNPHIYFEAHADPISVDLVRHQLEEFVNAGYTAICLEQEGDDIKTFIVNIKETIRGIESNIKELESHISSKTDPYSQQVSIMLMIYKKDTLPFQKELLNGIKHKLMFYEAILKFQSENPDKLSLYGIDTGQKLETEKDRNEIFEIYQNRDFSNPRFKSINLIRETEFAKNIKQISKEHDGGVIVILGTDHYGVHKALSTILPPKQSKQIKSFYLFSITDLSKLGSLHMGKDLISGAPKARDEFTLGIKVINLSQQTDLKPPDYQALRKNILGIPLKPSKGRRGPG